MPSEALKKFAKHVNRRDKKQRREKVRPLPDGERKALWRMRAEAREAGSKLKDWGRGGLSPTLVVGVMRRDEYRCKTCGRAGTDENGGLSIHHIGGIADSKRTSALGHKNLRSNLVTICDQCHDKEHNEARAEGVDSSQVLPSGDVGTSRDKGDRPLARPGKA